MNLGIGEFIFFGGFMRECFEDEWVIIDLEIGKIVVVGLSLSKGEFFKVLIVLSVVLECLWLDRFSLVSIRGVFSRMILDILLCICYLLV